jgi:hypothetical protein
MRTPPLTPPGLSKSLVKKMEMVLRELGIEERPLPTKTVVDYYDHLRKSIITLLTLHKVAAKKETLLHQRKLEIQHLGGDVETDVEVKVKRGQQQQMKRKVGDGGAPQNKKVRR